ncbi:hypothetical protein ABTQ33_04545 [Paucilactobacillus suebicus]|uniref:Uncharacterized protein n=1 Tax=Paucilactobacillus suebicus DSM 5007 = KCTC 3549 TaxID=1423807 RepID=A0A0R1W3U7_9LACO|nr:hypothetical protein [Paucilactobacillus suebicus]KRM10564.1 hypothetical protein FD16_GL001166 [Paucilactobacillus suebicus DSM 5007 = KCTC 3549]
MTKPIGFHFDGEIKPEQSKQQVQKNDQIKGPQQASINDQLISYLKAENSSPVTETFSISEHTQQRLDKLTSSDTKILNNKSLLVNFAIDRLLNDIEEESLH